MPLASAFTPTSNISSALAPLSRKNSLNQHFFIQKSKTSHVTVEFGQNAKNYGQPLASAFTPTYNISSTLAPLSRNNSLSQHFFIQKSKLVMKPLNLRANGGKHQKLLLGNNAPGKCLHAHMQHFFRSLAPLEHQKLLLGNNAPGKCLHAHIQHFFNPSPAI